MSLEQGLEVGQAFVISFLQVGFDHHRISHKSPCQSKASCNEEMCNSEDLGFAGWFHIKRFVRGDFRAVLLRKLNSLLLRLPVFVRYLDKLFEWDIVWGLLLIQIGGAGGSVHALELQHLYYTSPLKIPWFW